MSNQRYDADIHTHGLQIAALPFGTSVRNADLELLQAFVAQVVAVLPVTVPDGMRGFTVNVRPAKPITFEVWRSADVGEIHETTFTSYENATRTANELQMIEDKRWEGKPGAEYRDGYYIKRRWGRAKPEVVYRAKSD